MKPTCPKCKRPVRVTYSRKVIKGKKWWITKCIVCATPLDLEPEDKEKK